MPTDVTPSAAWTTPIQVPNDITEIADQASLLLSLQPIANRLDYLRQGVPGLAVSLAVAIPIVAVSTARFTWSTSLGAFYRQTDITDAGSIVWYLPLPRFGKIVSVSMLLDGSLSAHGALPATKPTLALFRYPRTPFINTAPTTIGTATDAPADVAAYEVPHTLTYTPGAPVTIDTTMDYYIQATGEAGANSVVNALAICRPLVTVIAA